MRTNILTTALALSDQDLLARIDALARTEREATAELVGHLAALELRPSLHAAQGYGSLFDYCTHVLHLSEDAACTRIHVARTCRRFPLILDFLYSGALSLSAVRLLGPHLTAENHEGVLARATRKRLHEVQALVAELAPRPDVPASMRRLPSPAAPASPQLERTLMLADGSEASSTAPVPATDGRGSRIGVSADVTAGGVPTGSPDGVAAANGANGLPNDARSGLGVALPAVPRTTRPVLQALAPQRYKVQFTIGQETHDAVKRLQALMRRELPDGDLAAIFDHGVRLLLDKVETAKFGVGAKTSRRPSRPLHSTLKSGAAERAYETRIRFKTDSESEPVAAEPRSEASEAERRAAPSRHIPSAVKRAVWRRDGGQCAFVSAGGRRCTERAFLELHHIHPHALAGPATAANISLRCRRHNQYEAELVFGPRDSVRETAERYRT
jgi:hypothetical protein